MMIYFHAEREDDWVLHLYAVSKMLPYFLCAGHYHYTRHGTYYLNDMGKLPPSIEEKFIRGKLTTRH